MLHKSGQPVCKTIFCRQSKYLKDSPGRRRLDIKNSFPFQAIFSLYTAHLDKGFETNKLPRLRLGHLAQTRSSSTRRIVNYTESNLRFAVQ